MNVNHMIITWSSCIRVQIRVSRVPDWNNKSTLCYKYRLSNLHIHHRLCRKSPGSIRRVMLRTTQPVHHPTETICTPCTIPEPIEEQEQQIDRIYPLPGRIYPLLLAHTIVLDRFHRGPMESLPNVISFISCNGSMSVWGPVLNIFRSRPILIYPMIR